MTSAAVRPRDVLIPLYGGSIARVRCGGVPPASHPAKLVPEIAHLLDNGLYAAGLKALGATALVRSKTHWRHLWQWLTRHRPPGVLWVVNATEVAGLSQENAASAELGLAIVQLMLVNSSRMSRVIATGKLPSLQATPATQVDLPIEPVGGIGEKFEAVIRAFRGRTDLPPAPTLFLVPEHLPTGEHVADVHGAKIARLQSELGIAVQPVATLGEAMRAVGAGHPATRFADRLAFTTLGLGASGLVLAGAAWWVLTIPVDVQFVPVPFPTIDRSTPIREAIDGKVDVPCLGARGVPEFRASDRIHFAAMFGDPGHWYAGLFGIRHALVTRSERDGVSVFVDDALPVDGRFRQAVGEGDVVGYEFHVDRDPGRQVIAIVAQRGWAIDGPSLRRNITELLEQIPEAERTNALLNYLAARFPHMQIYQFETVGDGQACDYSAH
jgi:hypothetical protein